MTDHQPLLNCVLKAVCVNVQETHFAVEILLDLRCGMQQLPPKIAAVKICLSGDARTGQTAASPQRSLLTVTQYSHSTAHRKVGGCTAAHLDDLLLTALQP